MSKALGCVAQSAIHRGKEIGKNYLKVSIQHFINCFKDSNGSSDNSEALPLQVTHEVISEPTPCTAIDFHAATQPKESTAKEEDRLENIADIVFDKILQPNETLLQCQFPHIALPKTAKSISMYFHMLTLTAMRKRLHLSFLPKILRLPSFSTACSTSALCPWCLMILGI
ncbi:hypothetical protein K7X08_002612 [Anisodus acutangulus]|uniref:Uncharacterized protein n=1 Tax=Anisodus acutangulus TaxID=402998 RepID=A0A9Q1LPI7_9SOLA|nr:hypothetical protein K7X08_002612 [Anisodus acutangulus]